MCVPNKTARKTFDTGAKTKAGRHAKCSSQLSGFKRNQNIDDVQQLSENSNFTKFVQQ
jgi:hypothetical protein